MMTVKMVDIMGDASDEMAIWGSIIHWYEQWERAKAGKEIYDISSVHCSLCKRYLGTGTGTDKCKCCPLDRCKESGSLWCKVRMAHNKNERAKTSKAMLDALTALLGFKIFGPPVESNVLVPEIEYEPPYKVGDKFELDGNTYQLIDIGEPVYDASILTMLSSAGQVWEARFHAPDVVYEIERSLFHKTFGTNIKLIEDEQS